jgi:hypothetical protein
MPVAASAASFTTTSDGCGEGCTSISIVGPILVNDDAQFDRLIKNQKIDKALVQLDSPGGYVPPMVAIGDRIHNTGFWTYVPNGAICTSACASIWLAGRKRFLGPNGRLGFHSTGQTVDGRRLPSPAGDAVVLAYFRRLALREDAINYFFAASTFDMSYVTLRKMRQLGVDCDSFPPAMVATLAPKSVPTTTFKAHVDKAAPEIVPNVEPERPWGVPIGGETIVPKTEPARRTWAIEPPHPDGLPLPQWEILGFTLLVFGFPVLFVESIVVALDSIFRRIRARSHAVHDGRCQCLRCSFERTLRAQAIGRQAVWEALRPKSKSPWARVQ